MRRFLKLIEIYSEFFFHLLRYTNFKLKSSPVIFKRRNFKGIQNMATKKFFIRRF